jgi:hypothetical protein
MNITIAATSPEVDAQIDRHSSHARAYHADVVTLLKTLTNGEKTYFSNNK